MAATIQTRKIEVEVPENVYQILQDIALFYKQDFDTSLKEIIYQNIDMELDGNASVPPDMGEFLQKKYGYVLDAWRSALHGR